MKRIKFSCASLLINAVLLYSSVAFADDTLRPEVGKPMMAAQDLVKAQKYKEAMAKVREAEAVSGRTLYENFIIDRMRATAAAGAGDTETAAKSFEAVINSGRLSPADHLKVLEALAGTYYRVKDYAHATAWIQTYFKNGGTNPQMRMLLIQSLYLGGDYASASKELATAIAAEERAGSTPPENMLQMQAAAQQKVGDTNGYVTTMERLIRHFPKPEYWADVIARVRSKPGFPDRLLLDVYRLQQASGSLSETSAYVEFAQLAIQDGYPAEASKVIGEGFDKKLLGVGSDAARHGRLRDMATRLAAEDRGLLLKKDKAGEKDANMLVNNGYAYVTHGDVVKGTGMLEKGIAMGGLKRPEDAMLHLGLAYLQSGSKTRAAQALKGAARSSGPVGDLARLWALLAKAD